MELSLNARGAGCPKSMVYGPCGGVDFDGTCEVAEHACVFLDAPTVRWEGGEGARGGFRDAPAELLNRRVGGGAGSLDRRDGGGAGLLDRRVGSVGGDAMRQLLGRRPIIVADFPARAVDSASLAECADVLAGSVDAVLAGDSGFARVQFSPSYRAALIQSRGLAVWTGLNARDRNRVALEGELAGLADVGVAAVHCVTGDHTLTGNRPDAQPVFDVDSTQLAALARAAGHLVSVGESPLTPPVDRRAARLVEKQRAGAEVAFVNHSGGAAAVARFIDEVRALQSHETDDPGLGELRYIACVPVVVDRDSAELLRSFTTLVLPEGYLDGILSQSDVRAAGVAAAARLSAEMLAIDGVVGVDLSGGTALGGELAFAGALAEVAVAVAQLSGIER